MRFRDRAGPSVRGRPPARNTQREKESAYLRPRLLLVLAEVHFPAIEEVSDRTDRVVATTQFVDPRLHPEIDVFVAHLDLLSLAALEQQFLGDQLREDHLTLLFDLSAQHFFGVARLEGE